MGKKLYVGNLPYKVSSSDLELMLSQFGKVESAEVIMDRETNRSKGFGFVEMSTDEEAQAAIAALSGKEHEGRALTVNEAKPREPRSGVTLTSAVQEVPSLRTSGMVTRHASPRPMASLSASKPVSPAAARASAAHGRPASSCKE